MQLKAQHKPTGPCYKPLVLRPQCSLQETSQILPPTTLSTSHHLIIAVPLASRGKQDAMAMVQVLVTQPSTALRARLLTRPGFIAAVPISSRMQLAASQSKSAAPEPGQTISVNASSLRSGDALSGHLFLLQGHDAYAPQSDFSTQHRARTCIYDRGIGEFIRLDFPKHVCQTCMSGANLSYKAVCNFHGHGSRSTRFN